ncbi:hypothetical protein Hanom_Chr16g01428111 [Helianthus anomalus]
MMFSLDLGLLRFVYGFGCYGSDSVSVQLVVQRVQSLGDVSGSDLVWFRFESTGSNDSSKLFGSVINGSRFRFGSDSEAVQLTRSNRVNSVNSAVKTVNNSQLPVNG